MKTKVSENCFTTNLRLFVDGHEVCPSCYRVECALIENNFFDPPQHEAFVKVFVNKECRVKESNVKSKSK